MNNPKNAGMQKMTDKVMRGEKSPASQTKTPEYKEFQKDSAIVSENVKNPNQESKDYINNKYRLGSNHLPTAQGALDFYHDASVTGYSGKKYEDSPTKQKRTKQEKKVSRLKKRGFVETVTTLDGDTLLEKRKSKKVKRKAVTSKGKTKRHATTKTGVDHTSIEMGK